MGLIALVTMRDFVYDKVEEDAHELETAASEVLRIRGSDVVRAAAVACASNSANSFSEVTRY